jgi:beta-N-acetylhexosaminidase
MTQNLRQAAGSLLMVGLGGFEITGLERAWLKLLGPAGIILFRRNIADAKQTRELLAAATAACAAHCLRSVDVEGGVVDRLRDALAPMPSARAVARTRQEKLSREHGELIGRAVKAFGFNTTLAPVLDLGLPESAAVMGTRCASATADGVIEYTRVFLSGLAKEDVAGCGKHFPGLGAGTLDSHQQTPSIERDWSTLWREDLKPYRTLRDALPMVMVNHALYPKTKDKTHPASVSKFWIQAILRKRIGYRGLILSDDLEMGGILNCKTMEEAAVEAIRAGTDLIEICHSPELIFRAYEALVAEAERSPVFREVVLARARESARKRARLYAEPISRPLTQKQFECLRDQILRFSAKVNASEVSA